MTCPRLRTLIAAHAATVACAGLCGALLSGNGAHRVRLDASPAPPPRGVLSSAGEIVKQNGHVWLAVCGGVVSFGAVGVAVLVTNGFRFGMDATTVARSSPHELRFLLPHSALEFGAFTLAAAACQYLAWQLWELLAFDRRAGRVVPGLIVLAASACLGLAAALVEAMSQAARAV